MNKCNESNTNEPAAGARLLEMLLVGTLIFLSVCAMLWDVESLQYRRPTCGLSLVVTFFRPVYAQIAISVYACSTTMGNTPHYTRPYHRSFSTLHNTRVFVLTTHLLEPLQLQPSVGCWFFMRFIHTKHSSLFTVKVNRVGYFFFALLRTTLRHDDGTLLADSSS